MVAQVALALGPEVRERERSVGRAGLGVLVAAALDARVAWAEGSAPRLCLHPPFTVRPCDETAIGKRLMFLSLSIKNNHCDDTAANNGK